MSTRYCPICEKAITVQSHPEVTGFCPNCSWRGGADEFLTEFKRADKSDDTNWEPYVSIDLETTGTDFEQCQILEFGAVIDNWRGPLERLPRFHQYIQPRESKTGVPYVTGHPYALALNAEILRKLADPETAICPESEVGHRFAAWLRDHDLHPQCVIPAGKNFDGFDLQFLNRLPNFTSRIRFLHRSIDPAIFYWQPGVDDYLPDMATCLKRAGLDGRVAHTAIEDCISVIQLIRRGVRKCHLAGV